MNIEVSEDSPRDNIEFLVAVLIMLRKRGMTDEQIEQAFETVRTMDRKAPPGR